MNVVFESTSRAAKTFYATEALTEYLDENEGYLLAKDALEEFTQSNDDAIDLADVVWTNIIAHP